jgi:hypothetical protein
MKNFGFIKAIYNDMLSEAISNKDIKRQKIFKTYLKTLKENEVLRTQFLIYKNIEDKIEESKTKAVEYIKENIALMNKYSKKEILESNKKLTKYISNKIDDFKNIYDENRMKPLHESISTLIFTEKNASTINKIIDSIDVASDYIKSNSTRGIKKVNESLGVSNEILTSIVVDKYNEKYKKLSKGSKKLINTILESSTSDKIEFFESTIKDCLGIVNEQIVDADLSLKESLLSVKENLLNRVFNESTFDVDILKIFQLKKDLNE